MPSRIPSPKTKLGFFLTLVTLAVMAGGVSAEPTVYLNQDEFISALVSMGLPPIHEGFESEAAWGGVRSSVVGGTVSAPAISHLGLRWTANNLSSEITTGAGPARSGDWGFYSIPHGSYTEPDPGTDCFVPGECGDGWRGAAVEGEFVAIGGWFKTNTPYAKLGIYLGDYPDNPVDLGETCNPPDSENCISNSVITVQHQFWGVVEAAGFAKFEFRELEGKLEMGGGDIKLIFADDFWFAFRASDRIFIDGFE